MMQLADLGKKENATCLAKYMTESKQDLTQYYSLLSLLSCTRSTEPAGLPPLQN